MLKKQADELEAQQSKNAAHIIQENQVKLIAKDDIEELKEAFEQNQKNQVKIKQLKKK